MIISMKYDTGKAGEEYAARQLKRMGYRIITRNYHSRFGEIDIIAEKCPYIVFVEVKTREAESLVTPLEAVTGKKQQKLAATASRYLAEHPTGMQPRFDVAAVHTQNGKIIGWDYLQNAF